MSTPTSLWNISCQGPAFTRFGNKSTVEQVEIYFGQIDPTVTGVELMVDRKVFTIIGYVQMIGYHFLFTLQKPPKSLDVVGSAQEFDTYDSYISYNCLVSVGRYSKFVGIRMAEFVITLVLCLKLTKSDLNHAENWDFVGSPSEFL